MGCACVVFCKGNYIMTHYLMLIAVLWLGINLVCVAAAVVTEDCTYGSSSDCIFPCNCADPNEVCDEESGHCSQCPTDVAGLSLYSTGPGCRVRDVSYHKPASARMYKMHKYSSHLHSPGQGVDGKLPPSSDGIASNCFHSDNIVKDPVTYEIAGLLDTDSPFWWMVDLEALYLIFNVTVYSRNFKESIELAQILQDYSVYVSNASDIAEHTVLCAKHPGYMESSSQAVLTCSQNLIGRYLSVINSMVSPTHHMFVLCEVVVMGVKPIDCSLCGNASNCDPLNGCQSWCLHGKRTPTCDRDIDECKSSPCMQGNCSNEVGLYVCSCNVGYTGNNCEIEIDECSSNPCLNGGECKDDLNKFTCECALGFKGMTCKTDIDECSSNPCLNGGECKDGVTKFTCECALGFAGMTCETDIDECKSSPCVQGNCSNEVGLYVCSCNIGYTGNNCELEIDECSSDPCGIGGTCHDAVAAYTCTCIEGYAESHCKKVHLFITPASIYLTERFRLTFTDMNSADTKLLSSTFAQQLGHKMNDSLNGFHNVTITMIRKRNESTVVDIRIATKTTFNATDIYNQISSALEEVQKTNMFSGYALQASESESKRKTQLEYVFTKSSFDLDETFKRVFFNMAHEESQKLTENLETLLNVQLNGNLEEFQFVCMTMLRKVGHHIAVNLLIVTLSPVDTIDTTIIRQSVKNALINVLSSGKLGNHLVKFASPSDIEVKLPSTGSPPPILACRYIFTTVSIQTERDFKMDYINTSNIETKILITLISNEMYFQFSLELDEFQFVDVLLIRNEKGKAKVDMEVVTLPSVDDIDVNAVKRCIEDILEGSIMSEFARKNVIAPLPGVLTVHSPMIGNPSPIQSYVMTNVTFTMLVKFIMDYTYLKSNASLHFMDQIKLELTHLRKYMAKFQFSSVVLLREEDKHTAIDINIASLTESFDASQVKKDIQRALKEVLKGGPHKVDSSSILVGTPLIGKMPPHREYAFTRASLQLKETWKKEYNDPKHPDTRQLVFSLQEELNYAFGKTKNQEVEVTGIREENKEVSASFFVASLTIVDEYNSTLIEETFINVMEEVVGDGEVGGFAVSASNVDVFKLEKTILGEIPQKSTAARDPIITSGEVTPGTHQWIMTLVIAGCCVCGTMALVFAMYSAVKDKEAKKKKSDDDAERASEPTNKSTISAGDRRSSSGSSETP